MKTSKTFSRREFVKTLGVSAATLAVGWPLLRSSAQGQSDSDSRTYAVGMRTRDGIFEFDPVALRINPGDTVTWFQIADFHSTTAYHPNNNNHQLRIPEDAEPWDSGILGLGGKPLTFSRQFENPEGVYDYFCIPHEFLGMVGRIIVGEALPGPATEQPLPDLAKDVIPAVDVITGLAGSTFNGTGEINLPLLRLFEKNAAEAASEADALLQRFLDGEAQDGSLWEALQTAKELDPFRTGLDQFVRLVKSGPAFADALKSGDELKAILKAARDELIGS